MPTHAYLVCPKCDVDAEDGGLATRRRVPPGADGARAGSGLESPPSPPARPSGQRRTQADVAQLVEQLIRNQQVTGSNPVVGSRLRPAEVGR